MKKRSDYRSDLDKAILNMYVFKQLSMKKVGEALECDMITVRNHLINIGIPRRESMKLLKNRLKLSEKQTDLAYLAGLIDGEGNINLMRYGKRRGKHCPSVIIVNTNKKVMCWICKATGICPIYHSSMKNRRKPLLKWDCRRALEVLELLQAVVPYLVIKEDIALEAIDLCEKMREVYSEEVFLAKVRCALGEGVETVEEIPCGYTDYCEIH